MVMHMRATDRTRHLLACLGDASRFRIVVRLAAGPRCVTEIAAQVGLSQSCTTRHLQALRREGLARSARLGKRVVYRLRDDDPEARQLLAWAMSERGRAARRPARTPERRAASAGPRPAGDRRPPRSRAVEAPGRRDRGGPPAIAPRRSASEGGRTPKASEASRPGGPGAAPVGDASPGARAPHDPPGPPAAPEPAPDVADPASAPARQFTELEDYLL
ncbi:MAG: hypothetical protein A2W00_03515 [Candidatus Eisenbacteria bacterium RBG_16_71_46]|nr:MAG: hypothetical protein A2W00_03515 [Candidatus Eisenbacteria bacterium RBG_16_71_46]